MAIIQRGILGGFSNKIGNVVGTSWKGIAVMKSLPLSVANPRTAGQVAQRIRFGGASKLFSSVLATIAKPLNDRFAQRESGFNAIVQRNITRISNTTGLLTDYPLIAKGRLVLQPGTAFTADASSDNIQVTLNWVTGESNLLGTDLIYVMAVRASNGDTYVSSGEFTMDDTSAIISGVPVTLGEHFWVSVAVRRADGSQVSDTVGEDVIAVA